MKTRTETIKSYSTINQIPLKDGQIIGPVRIAGVLYRFDTATPAGLRQLMTSQTSKS